MVRQTPSQALPVDERPVVSFVGAADGVGVGEGEKRMDDVGRGEVDNGGREEVGCVEERVDVA